jgi:hypothetical protein
MENEHDDLLSWLLFSDQVSFDGSAPVSPGTGLHSLLPRYGKIGEVGSDDSYEDFDADAFDFDTSASTAPPVPSSSSSSSAQPISSSSSSGAASRKRSRPRSAPTSGAGAGAGTGAEEGKKKPRDDVRYLEEKIKALQDENDSLTAHVLNVTQRTTEVQKHRLAMEKEMAEKMNDPSGENQAALAELCKRYSDNYSDYGVFRQREVAFHLGNIEKLLVPTLVTKMSLWTLQQEQTFYQSPVFDSISKALDMSQEQIERIQQGRQRIKALLVQLQESLSLVGQLRTAIAKRHGHYDAQCGGVAAIATPAQTVKFLLWVSEHSAKISRLMAADDKSKIDTQD